MARAGDRGQGKEMPRQNAAVTLPYRPFLFTVDQIAVILDIDPKAIMAQYLYYEGRSIGSRHRDLMIARNIAPTNEKPDWRIAERELVRWMRFKGFRYYERAVTVD